MKRFTLPILITIGTLTAISFAQRDGDKRGRGDGPPPPKKGRTATEAQPLKLNEAKNDAPADNKVTLTVLDDKRIIESNGMPEHKIGQFPVKGNPNTPSEQKFRVELPLKPKVNDEPTPARGGVGVFLNGVMMDSGTGEFFFPKSEDAKPWNYNALGGAINLGIDANHAHVQPSGKYHYHGLPTGLLKEMKVNEKEHSPIIGWAFDGFPIYGLYGYEDPKDPNSKIIENTSGYRLKEGNRPEQPEGPGGKYDGAFNEDFEYIKGLGTLDECNGRFTITPEFPEGTYAYFLTTEWPVLMRNFRGASVVKRGPRNPK